MKLSNSNIKKIYYILRNRNPEKNSSYFLKGNLLLYFGKRNPGKTFYISGN